MRTWLPDMSGVRAEHRITPEAERELDSIWLYTSETWVHQQANGDTVDLIDTFSQLAHNPKPGMSGENIRRGYCRYRVGRHLVYYRMSDFKIAIVRVSHKRMLQTRHLQGAA
jgi:toxin ParE1/3/4